MVKIGYIIAKLKYKLFGNNHEIMNQYYRRKGVSIGKGTVICSNLDNCDECCVQIGDNVVVSTEVLFVTHDFSISRVVPESPSLFGKIKVGNNCFIGERATIMYGVELADNIIVAAGSVVTKSVGVSNVVIGGVPARIICDWDEFSKKYNGKGIHGVDIAEAAKRDDERLIKRKMI